MKFKSLRGGSKPATPDPRGVEPQEGAEKPQSEAEVVKDEPIDLISSHPEDAKSPERPSTLSVEPIIESTVPVLSPAGSTISRRDSQLTDRGFFDVKFYHNKLW